MKIASYPVFVVKIQGGYASISTPESSAERPEYAILVFSTEALAEKFIRDAPLENAEVFFLKSERELAKVLVLQKPPFTHMAWDTTLADGRLTTTCVAIPEMLLKHLPLARSPWDYPIWYLKDADENLVVITTQNKEGKPLSVLCLFTTRQRAEQYREKVPHSKSISVEAIASPHDLKAFLVALPDDFLGIGFNPEMREDNQPTSTYCLRKEKVLEKYLSFLD
ncbi:MAG: hypothetical protein Q4D62_12160 [Planctomycetia bacterium]|nr:hypothetical protein [Planctomycetia bacterium]